MSEPDRIKVGDAVTAQFWPMYSDICGIVEYVPSAPGDSWIIKQSDGSISYVQTFASITRGTPITDSNAPVTGSDDLPF
jgi:hypothetical protein